MSAVSCCFFFFLRHAISTLQNGVLWFVFFGSLLCNVKIVANLILWTHSDARDGCLLCVFDFVIHFCRVCFIAQVSPAFRLCECAFMHCVQFAAIHIVAGFIFIPPCTSVVAAFLTVCGVCELKVVC